MKPRLYNWQGGDIYRSELTISQKSKICQAIKNPKKSLSKDVKMPKNMKKMILTSKQPAKQPFTC